MWCQKGAKEAVVSSRGHRQESKGLNVYEEKYAVVFLFYFMLFSTLWKRVDI